MPEKNSSMKRLGLIIEPLRAWLASQKNFTECLHPSQVDEARRLRAAQLETGEHLTFEGDEHCYTVWESGHLEEDTGRQVSRLWAWKGDSDGLTRLLEHSLRNRPGQSLLVERFVKNGFPKKALKIVDFSLQRYKLTLVPEVHDLSEERYQDFTIREATELDRSLLCSLATNNVAHTLPPGEESNVEAYTQSILSSFQELDYGEGSAYTLFIAERGSTRRSVGYILVREDSDGSIFLYDMGVKKAEWGRWVGHFMVRSVENLLVDLGYELMYSEISAANRRSYLSATRQIKFRPFLEFWQKNS